VPGFVIRLGELKDIVSCLVKHSLKSHWARFLGKEPPEAPTYNEVGDRLYDVNAAVGETKLVAAVRNACIQFRQGLKFAPEIEKTIWSIFLFGDDGDYQAAAIVMEALNDDEYAARDKCLRKIHEHIVEGPERDIPPEIGFHLERIRQSNRTSIPTTSGNR